MTKQIQTTSADVAQTVTFHVLKAPKGVPKHLQTLVEEIRTPGVSGTVYRELGKQYEPFPILAIKYFTTFAAAVEHNNNMELLRNAFVTLTTDEHGTHENVIIRSVESRPLPGTGVGNGIPDGTVAYVRTTFTMVRA